MIKICLKMSYQRIKSKLNRHLKITKKNMAHIVLIYTTVNSTDIQNTKKFKVGLSPSK